MFFEYRIYENEGSALSLSRLTSMAIEGLTYGDFIENALLSAIGGAGSPITSIEWHIGMPASVKKRIGDRYIKSDEGYAIVLGSRVRVYAATERGFIYAAATLSTLASGGELYEGFLYDVPVCETRIFRCYLPSRAGMEDFFRLVDFLAMYKYNMISIEIGGSMEYHRHPEINRVWEEFCRDMRRYSGRADEVQFKTYPWPKNCIHCDNADGDILTQDECRTLAAYCRSRGLKIIPHVLLLSHTDYIVMAHPELREREGDLHPDTYCPRHPDVYKYVFDILEEIIDVFRPEAVNIGHDETYSIGICPRCKGTPAYKLYADDVIRIYNFLKERGISTIMSGEKLLNARYGKNRIGGAGRGKGDVKIPAIWPARDLLPKDILINHWYWRFNEEYDKVYLSRGMKAFFGNCNALATEHFSARCRRGICGGQVANWGPFADEYMQRNQQYLALLSSAYAFFCENIDPLDKKELLRHCFEEGYRCCISRTKHPIEITHTTAHSVPFEWVWDGIFITDEKYLLGNYELTYTDGTVATLPVRYGSHIGCANIEKTLGNSEFMQLVYSVLPILHDGAYAYRTIYEDPHPEKTLSCVRYCPASGREDAEVTLIGFSRRAPDRFRAMIKGCADTDFGADIVGLQE